MGSELRTRVSKLPPAMPWALGCSFGVAAAQAVAVPVWSASMILLLALCLLPRFAAAGWLVGLGGGALVGAVAAPADLLSEIGPRQPVEVVGRVIDDPWPADDGGRRCRLQVERVRQGRRVLRPATAVNLRLPEGTEHIVRGHGLRLRGYLSRPPALRNLRPPVPGPWRLNVESRRFAWIDRPPPRHGRPIAALRASALRALGRWPDPRAAALVATLWLGDRSALPEPWRRSLRAWGLAHLTAVSGLHVGVVALLAYGCGLLLPRRARLGLTLLAVVVYALVVGPRPSVVRAAVMALVAIGALLSERPPDGRNALPVAVAGMVLWQPRVISDLGFQLSVAATAGLLVLGLPLARALQGALEAPEARPGRPSWWVLGLSSTLAAQLSVMPIAVPTFALVHPLSPLCNLIAVPWLAVTLISGLLGLGVSILVPDAGWWAALPATLCAWPVERLGSLPVGPWVSWPAALGAGGATVVALLLVLALLRRPRLGLAGLLAVGLIVAGAAAWRGPGGAEVEVVAIDVGQGDAILLRHLGGRAVLVDGGGWRHGDLAARALVPTLADLGVRRLHAVVLSHPDVDHCAGLVQLTSYLAVEEVWSSPGWSEGCAGELLGRPAIRWRPLWRGRRVAFGPWSFETLWPPAEAGPPVLRGNDRSLVLRAEAAGRRLLLTGDIGLEVERRLAAEHREALAANLLKLAHHGSKSSSAAFFLDAVGAEVALVQAGRGNFYGHPHASVIGRLQDRSVRVLRTDRHGLIRLRWREGGPLSTSLAASAVDRPPSRRSQSP